MPPEGASGSERPSVKHTHIGGQAVLEGIMMRGKFNWAIAVRLPSGEIHVEEHDLSSAARTRPWLRKPVIRGVWGLYETLVLAMQALSISASYAGETEEERLSAREIGLTMVLGIALAVGLFIVLPALATNWAIGSAAERPFAWNMLDGVLRLVAFFAYIWAVSRIRDIQRVFAYHGAEHKTIHAFEQGVPLEPTSIQQFGTLHVRCGTSFLLMVMVVALLVFSVVPVKAIVAGLGLGAGLPTLLVAISLRVLLLPLIAGLAYEVIKWAGSQPDSTPVRILLWPGLQLQRMTTRDPDEGMLEIAVRALEPVVRRERRESGEAEEVHASASEQPVTVAAAEND